MDSIRNRMTKYWFLTAQRQGVPALELAPVRVNAIHPGIVADTPFWSGKREFLENVRARTSTGRNVQAKDIVDAWVFLLENQAMNRARISGRRRLDDAVTKARRRRACTT